jgi:hypothetical protein
MTIASPQFKIGAAHFQSSSKSRSGQYAASFAWSSNSSRSRSSPVKPVSYVSKDL